MKLRMSGTILLLSQYVSWPGYGQVICRNRLTANKDNPNNNKLSRIVFNCCQDRPNLSIPNSSGRTNCKNMNHAVHRIHAYLPSVITMRDRFTLLRKPKMPDSESVTSCENAPSSDCHIYLPDIDFLYLNQQSWAQDRASGQLALKAQIRFDKRIRIIEQRLDTQSAISTRAMRIPQKKSSFLLLMSGMCLCASSRQADSDRSKQTS